MIFVSGLVTFIIGLIGNQITYKYGQLKQSALCLLFVVLGIYGMGAMLVSIGMLLVRLLP